MKRGQLTTSEILERLARLERDIVDVEERLSGLRRVRLSLNASLRVRRFRRSAQVKAAVRASAEAAP